MTLQTLLQSCGKGGSDRRVDRRLKIFEPATMSWAGVEERVHFLNVNRGGALLDAAIAPGTDEKVVLHWQGKDFPGRCMWCHGRRFGVAFMPLIRPEDVAYLLTA